VRELLGDRFDLFVGLQRLGFFLAGAGRRIENLSRLFTLRDSTYAITVLHVGNVVAVTDG
jgi:hypothetical protein